MAAAAATGVTLADDDVLVVTQKIVSKAEGRLVDLATVEPSRLRASTGPSAGAGTRGRSRSSCASPPQIVRMGPGGLIISRTRHGLVCANAGVDV